MIITIGGYPASGKGTSSKMLAKALGYEYIGIGDMWRAEAERRGMTLNEFHDWCTQHHEWDAQVEEQQRALGKRDNIVLDSRLGFYCIPNSYKIYLTVAPEVAAKRLLGAKREEESVQSVDQALAEIKTRVSHETEKHLLQYGIDPHKLDQFDAIIDSTGKTPEEVTQEILTHVQK